MLANSAQMRNIIKSINPDIPRGSIRSEASIAQRNILRMWIPVFHFNPNQFAIDLQNELARQGFNNPVYITEGDNTPFRGPGCQYVRMKAARTPRV